MLFNMHKIRFEPSGRQAEITDGDTILTAADRAGVLIVAPCGGRGVCRKCTVNINGQEVLACLHQPTGDAIVGVPHAHFTGDASERKAFDYLHEFKAEEEPQDGRLLAIDLGTTGISVAWIDQQKGEVCYSKARNQQAIYGADVLSRIMMTEEEGVTGRATMQRLARQSIAEAIAQLGSIDQAAHIVISANPTMVYLLLGWDASPIRRSPSPRLELTPAPMPAPQVLGEVMPFAPGAALYILPGVANYLGGDVMAGVALARRFHPGDRKFLFIDAGTNGEIVLAAEDAILGIATSAGPAFEGGEVGSGVPAMPGAIEKVRIPAGNLWADYSTIGDVTPIGICGSGIIELVAELYKSGVLEKNGKIRRGMTADVFSEDELGRAYVLAPAASTANGRTIAISDMDLNAIINTKAAIFAGCQKLASTLGISYADLDRIFIAGDFGYHINIDDAITIGMLPDIDRAKYTFMGNASLAGAALAGISHQFADEIGHLAQMTTFLDLSEDLEFIHEFMAACFLPHTNLELFPSSSQQPTLNG
jgi:uncharacterized 2Fe-2S/4Fe-4S cluster protein (DUF4445 family)